MSEPSDYDAKSNANFLVQIFPEDAIAILSQRSICNLKLVEQRVDDACHKLGDIDEIRGLVKSRQLEKLHALKSGAYNCLSPTSAAMTPNVRGSLDYRPTGQAPPSPMSTASGSQQSQRTPNHDLIFVYHEGMKLTLTARSSGSEAYLIGEDKLKRFQGLTPFRTSPQKVTHGGELIEVDKYVQLTWNRPDNLATDYEPFWVVDQGVIRYADALLGYKKQQSREGKDKGL
jgi:hypothetical protein